MAAKKKTRKVAAKKTARKSAKKAPARKPAKKAARKKAPVRKKKATTRRKKASVVDERVEQIQRVIDVMVAAGAVEVEMKDADTQLRVRLKEDPPLVSYAAAPPAALAAQPMAAMPVAGAPAGEEAAPVPDDPKRYVMNSPMVGTFYRAASPDADAFCDVGDHIEEDSTIFILEAMKVMNEIKAEVSGEVIEILAQNGEPVEYGQPLFVIRLD